MTKKIGILTQPLHHNYGGLLQNYALQQALIKAGYSPETIDHDGRKVPRIYAAISQLKDYLMHWLWPTKNKKPRYVLKEKEIRIIRRNTQHFIEKHILHTKPFHTDKELKKIIRQGDYTGYVVGSDQCWRPIYSGGFLKEMFLSFAVNEKNIKRVAYAASFGTNQWEFTPEQTEECSRLARLFDFISVREDSGVDLCKIHLGVQAQHVLDPTLLLSKEDYIRLVEEEAEPKSPGTLFYYILDPSPEKNAFIKKMGSTSKLKPFTVLPICQAENRTRWDVKHHIEDCVYPSVTSWLRAFMDCELVIVDSFHGAVFSIIFNKPFWVISNSERGNARFDSLLKLFGLEDRLVNSSNLFDINSDDEIDWNTVNSIRLQKCKESEQSFNYLK